MPKGGRPSMGGWPKPGASKGGGRGWTAIMKGLAAGAADMTGCPAMAAACKGGAMTPAAPPATAKLMGVPAAERGAPAATLADVDVMVAEGLYFGIRARVSSCKKDLGWA